MSTTQTATDTDESTQEFLPSPVYNWCRIEPIQKYNEEWKQTKTSLNRIHTMNNGFKMTRDRLKSSRFCRAGSADRLRKCRKHSLTGTHRFQQFNSWGMVKDRWDRVKKRGGWGEGQTEKRLSRWDDVQQSWNHNQDGIVELPGV